MQIINRIPRFPDRGLGYKARVVKEKEELDGKITRLSGFIFSDKFSVVMKDEQERMERQLYVMMDYSRCLKDRIAAF